MVPPSTIADILRGNEIFAGLDRTAIVACSRAVSRRELTPGETLIRHDDLGSEVFFVIAGTLRVIIYAPDGRPVLFRDIGPGETVGELAAIDGKPRSASVEARTNSEVLAMDARKFRDLVAREPSVAMAMLRRTIGLVRELSDRLFQLSSLGVANRIHAELLRLVGETGSRANRVILSPTPRQSDIADRIATNREAVSREVSHLTRRGILTRQGKALVVVDVQRLRELVNAPSD